MYVTRFLSLAKGFLSHRWKQTLVTDQYFLGVLDAWSSKGPFYKPGLTLISSRMSNYIHYKVWDEITYPFPNFNGAVIEVCSWLSNFIPHFTVHVINHQCWDSFYAKPIPEPMLTVSQLDQQKHFQWHFNWKYNILIQNVVCDIEAILFQHQYVEPDTIFSFCWILVPLIWSYIRHNPCG